MAGSSWHCTGGSDQDHTQKEKWKKGKCLSEEVSQIAMKRGKAKGKGEKGEIYPIRMQNSKE